MSFYANVGYHFALPAVTDQRPAPDGSIMLALGMPAHSLLRRRIDARYPHLSTRLFDPQLYLAGLDATQVPKHCAYLASYPWFQVTELAEYASSEQTQSNWTKESKKVIANFWPQSPPTTAAGMNSAVAACFDFQERLECNGWIIPSPLTTDSTAGYQVELDWLDTGLRHIRDAHDDTQPIFASVAVADRVLRYTRPEDNTFLELIADTIGSRAIDGVYMVLEQGSSPTETRQCGDIRSLQSVLHLVHMFANDCGLRVIVNFVGQFGLVCRAAGAEIWASAWYKSLHRLRLADVLAGGRAYPSYWSYPTLCDIDLRDDFDRLVSAGLLSDLADETAPSAGLLQAAAQGHRVRAVPDWQYRATNVTASREHYYRSCMQAEDLLRTWPREQRLNEVEKWLTEAVDRTVRIEDAVGGTMRTRTQHVQAWLQAFLAYRDYFSV